MRSKFSYVALLTSVVSAGALSESIALGQSSAGYQSSYGEASTPVDTRAPALLPLNEMLEKQTAWMGQPYPYTDALTVPCNSGEELLLSDGLDDSAIGIGLTVEEASGKAWSAFSAAIEASVAEMCDEVTPPGRVVRSSVRYKTWQYNDSYSAPVWQSKLTGEAIYSCCLLSDSPSYPPPFDLYLK